MCNEGEGLGLGVDDASAGERVSLGETELLEIRPVLGLSERSDGCSSTRNSMRARAPLHPLKGAGVAAR